MTYLRLACRLLVLTLLGTMAACRPAANTDNRHTARFRGDSLHLIAQADRLSDEGRDREAIPYLDSALKLPYTDADGHIVNPGLKGEGTLTLNEARWFANTALRYHLVGFNILMDFEGGYRHLDSLERLRLPIVETYCKRGLWVTKAQMLMALNRHNEAVDYLNRAMQLDTTHLSTGHDEGYWLAAAGITYMGTDSASNRAEQALHSAITLSLRTHTYNSLLPQAFARLGNIYLMQGKYQPCIDLCRQADSLAVSRNDDWGRLLTAETLTNAFRTLGLNRQALQYCSIGTTYRAPKEINHNLVGRFFGYQAAIYSDMGLRDSCLLALDKADSCYRRANSEYFLMWTQIDRAYEYSFLPDSLPVALHMLARLEGQVPPHHQSFYNYRYGTVCTRAGQWQRAIPLLKAALSRSLDINELHIAADGARLLTECYRHTGQDKALAEFLPTYQSLADSVMSHTKIRQLTAANIGFETQKKEQQNRLLTARIEAGRQRTLFLLAGCALLLLMLTGYIVYSRRLSRKNLELVRRIRSQEMAEQQTIAMRQALPYDSLSPEEKLFHNIEALLQEQALFTTSKLSREDIAQLLHTNATYVANAIRCCTDGLTVSEYINLKRVKYARQLFEEQPQLTIDEVSECCGFSSRSRFHTAFKSVYEMTPGEFYKAIR